MASPFDIAVDYYQQNLGLTPEQARGAVRWMDRIESGLNPTAVNPTSGAYGIGQWLGPRKRSLFEQYGSAPTFGQQLEHSVAELRGPESRALEMLRGAKTEDEAFRLWGKHYERPSAAEYAKATGGYSSGLRTRSGNPPEGYYGGALHVTVRPEGVEPEFPMDAALDGLLGGAEPEREQSPSFMLDELLGTLPPEEQKKPAPTDYIEPPGQFIPEGQTGKLPEVLEQQAQKPIKGIEPRLPEDLPAPAPTQHPIPDTIEPPGMGRPAPPMQAPIQQAVAAPAPEPPRRQVDVGTGIPLETGPQRGQMPADTFLDQLLSGATDVGTSLAGLAERFNLGVANMVRQPGSEPARAAIPIKPALEGALTFLTGGLLNPLSTPLRGAGQIARGAAQETRAAVPGALADTAGGVRPTLNKTHTIEGGLTRYNMQAPDGSADVSQNLIRDESGALRLPPEMEARAKSLATSIENGIKDAYRGTQLMAVPMAAGTEPGMAVAKDWANATRLARAHRSTWDTPLRKLPVEDQVRMWEAMDNASVAAQEALAAGRSRADAIKEAGAAHLGPLPRNQQNMLIEMDRGGADLWEQARDAGMVAEGAERLPFYVPRNILEITEGGDISRLASRARGGLTGLDQPGGNIAAGAGRPLGRKHLTAEETEAAARKATGSEDAQIVRNIRALPIAYEKFERQIATRRLINDLKEIGEATGRPAVVEGERVGDKYFTMPGNPAFRQPRMRRSNETGLTEPLRDPETGQIIYDQLWISREFEGPLKAIMSTQSGIPYKWLMNLKASAMSMVMMSPLIHNQVEWGRALGAMPGKVATFKIYGTGSKTLADTKAMEQAIRDGLVPIGERGYLQDIEGIASATDLAPGRGLFAKGVGAAIDVVSPEAGQAFRRGVDKAGDFWHQKLLWDQVAKLQAGLYTEFKDHLLKKGVGGDAAGKVAAHLANRYAGAIPNESMSNGARKLLNGLLFSRSFTMGNLGVIKDMVNGLPRDVRAQIGRELTEVEAKAVQGLARRKAIATVAGDIAIGLAVNALLQDGIEALRNDPEGALGRGGLGAAVGMIGGRMLGGVGGAAMGGIAGALAGAMTGDIQRIADDYMDRLSVLLKQGKENPLSLLNPLNDLMELLPGHYNEPDKGERVLLTHARGGQAIYGRSPIGKLSEEFVGWLAKPLGMLENKWGTLSRPVKNIINNDRGFAGQVEHVYNPYPHGLGDRIKNVGSIIWELARHQTNVSQVEAGLRALGITGEGAGDWVDAAQATAPFAGFTVSKGAPGGEMVGELYQARGEHQAKLQAAMPKIRDLVKGGKEEQAAAMLDELGVHPRLRQYYLRVFADPSRRLSGKVLHEFERYATPEQKKRMEMQQRRQTREPVAR